MREALGIDDKVTTMTPAELMRAILLADVDLLWNGGIGTYVKAASETNAEVGDKANDAIRVDGGQLRAKAVGEGGNLGLTQRGRIEYARNGGRINTDFIDNSAGVDTSDHEVNIKILLDRVVADGDLTGKQRNDLLAAMTDEVGRLVLRDNYEQNLALASAARNAGTRCCTCTRTGSARLERRGLLDRALEALPSRKEVAARSERKEGLTVPELSVLLAYTKIVLADDLLDTDLPDDPFLRVDLFGYFPTPMRQHLPRADGGAPAAPGDHRDPGGQRPGQRRRHHLLPPALGGDRRVGRRAGAGELRRPRDLRLACPHRRDRQPTTTRSLADVQTRMRLEMRTLVERASRWLINNRRPPLDSEAPWSSSE